MYPRHTHVRNSSGVPYGWTNRERTRNPPTAVRTQNRQVRWREPRDGMRSSEAAKSPSNAGKALMD